MTNYHYVKPIWRVITALVVGTGIVLLGRSLSKAATDPSFYFAATFSCSVALALIFWVHRVTIRLDRRAPWKKKPVSRIFRQLFLGVVVPTLADVGLFFIMYFLNLWKMSVEAFLLVDLPVIFVSLIAYNVIYCSLYLWHLLLHRETELTEARTKIKTADENDLLAQFEIPYEGGNLLVDVRTEIVAFFREDRKVWALDITGKRYVIPQNLAELAERFATLDFQHPNRSTIVNCAFVKRFKDRDAETWQVVFKEEALAAIGKADDPKYRITEKYIGDFQSRFKGTN